MNVDLGKSVPTIILDWLQFTVHNISYTDTIITLLHLEVNDFIEVEKGKMGYKSQVFCNNISILYDGTESMGVHVVISGKGCRFYENSKSLLDLIKRVDSFGGNVTRIDIAMDDKTGDYIPFRKMLADIKRANIISKWKTNTEIVKRDNKTAEVLGRTITVGSRTSNTYLRIYDKALEQRVEGIWYRIEIEIKGKSAQIVQKTLSTENVGSLFVKLLNNYIRFLKRNKDDSNKSRWETQDYWTHLLNTSEKISLSVVGEETSIEKIKSWIEKQVAPSLAVLAINDGGSYDYLLKQITLGSYRLKPKHLKLLNQGDDKKNV